MEDKRTECSRDLRRFTDESLKEERDNTDKHLKKRSNITTRETEETIRNQRMLFDETKQKLRDNTDKEAKGPGRANNSINPSDTVVEARKSIDSAQEQERIREDEARYKERRKQKLITEALLENERRHTDANLSDERSQRDFEFNSESSNHLLTKEELVTRNQFLAVVSHDLKSPLSSVSLSASLLRRSLETGNSNPADLLKQANIIIRNAAVMDRMISDLLDVEKMANGKLVFELKEENICDILSECEELFSAVLMVKNSTLRVESCDRLIVAPIDRDRIIQVLSNLIGNALKFTPAGGEVCVWACRNGANIEISVSDNGPGIPEEMKAKIFDRFSQLGNHDRSGLGLGLFISKWFIEAHHGEIWVESDVGRGSKFTFSLPTRSQ
jgi:signal transduction histidine kinase